MQHKRPIVKQEVVFLESKRPRAEIWVSLVLWEDLQACIFCPGLRFSARVPRYFFSPGCAHAAPVTWELWHGH